ncbi:MAG: BamA/TamA family outer membrane protein [Spirochaetia bacterium]
MNTAALRRLVLCIVFSAAAISSWAMGDENPYVMDIQPHIIGVDVGIGYRGLALLPTADTTIWAYLGGVYEWMSYYRDSAGNLIAPGSLAATGSPDPGYTRIEGSWRLGIDQGFAWNPRTKRNLVEAFAFYRGRVDANQINAGELLYASSLPDRTGILLNMIQVGAAYDNVLTDAHHKGRDGVSAEVSAEWGPRFFFNTLFGDSDYLRFNGSFTWFLPLFDAAPDRPVNLFNVYLAEYLSVDYAVGLTAPVPLVVRQTFGGRNQLDGLGGQVRGVDSDSLDTNLKAVNNLEIRLNLQPIVLPDIVPGLVAFWDSGFYDQVGEAGISSPGSGFVASVGAGAYLDFLDLGTGAVYVTYRLDNVNASGNRLGFMLEFGLHF